MMAAYSPKSRKITLKDVAEVVGVSAATVSNAFARPRELSAELRTRILRTARELGYPGPNPLAQHLSTGQTGTIGLVFSEELSYAFSDPVARTVFEGISHECQRAQVNLLLIPSRIEHNEKALSEPLTIALDSAAVDGFIAYGLAADSAAINMLLIRQLPIVTIDQPRIPGICSVTIDDRAAAYALASSLVRSGHRSFGILSLSSQRDEYSGLMSQDRIKKATYGTTTLRLEGYIGAISGAGISEENIAVWECAFHSEESGEKGALALLTQSPHRPTAIIAMSDRLAIGALSAIRQLDLSVPDSVAVTGFDGIPDARSLNLSTVIQPMEEKGRSAARILFNILSGKQEKSVCLATGLALRESSDRLY